MRLSFFFQAEDGIRDSSVTGVQTCALPISPGTIDTAINPGVSEFRRRMLEHRIPIARPGRVDDIAAACLYLASDAAGYVTGSVLAVDGAGAPAGAPRPAPAPPPRPPPPRPA